MRSIGRIASALFISAVLLVGAQAAFATVAALKIDAVEFAGNNIEILGKQFDTAPVTVSIAGYGALTLLSVTNTVIEAELPSLPDGSYLLSVSTGTGNKQNADTVLKLGGTMSIVCLDWYVTAGHEEHIHVEGYVQDENGDPVIGAAVTLRNTVDTGTEVREWQLKTSTTFKYAGYNHGESCPLPVAKESGATGQFCCIGLGAHEPFCPTGRYESQALSVQPPSGSNAVWDGVTPDNFRDFVLE
jgi:hypothetical protein